MWRTSPHIYDLSRIINFKLHHDTLSSLQAQIARKVGIKLLVYESSYLFRHTFLFGVVSSQVLASRIYWYILDNSKRHVSDYFFHNLFSNLSNLNNLFILFGLG